MRRLFAAAAIAALTLGTAACGSDDDESSATTESEAEAAEDTEADDEPNDTAAPDDDSGDDDVADDTTADDTTADDDDGDVPSGDLSEETCRSLAARISEQMAGETAFGDFAEAFDDVKSVTPDEIDDDLDVLSEAYAKLAAVIQENGGDLATAMQDPEVLAEMQALDSPAIQEANENVSAFFAEACPGVEFES